MRTRWAEAGLPVPPFPKVASLPGLGKAAASLRVPFLLNAAGRGGGIGQRIIGPGTDLRQAWQEHQAALTQAAANGIVEYSGGLDVTHSVAEEIIESTTQSWCEMPGYRDFLSVEGIVAEGTYHPLCITARFPTLPPFAEIGTLSPCVIAGNLPRKIEDLACRAVGSLGLETCGTHTELKLMAGQGLCLPETAARVGGSTALSLAEHVFGLDVIGMLASEVTGEPYAYPQRMVVTEHGAAASIFLFGADSRGRPWSSQPPFWWDRLDWQQLPSPDSRVEIMPSQMIPPGTSMPLYEPGRGALNYAGGIVVTSTGPAQLLADSYRLIDGLEAAVCATADKAVQAGQGG